MTAHEASFAANEALWNAWTAVHSTGDFYDLEGFKAGGVRIRPYEIEMIGDVAGKSLLHLQCHFGIDTLSWARLGARVTGADLSPDAIELARSLADELGFPDARFVRSNLYDLPDALDGTSSTSSTPRAASSAGSRTSVPGRASSRTSSRRAARSSSPRSTRSPQVFENEGVAPGRAAPGLPVLGARRAADVRGQGLLRRPDRRRRRRPDRARLGPRPGRDRDRPDRRRAAHRDARSSTRSSTGRWTSSSRTATTGDGASRPTPAASCR